MRASAERGRISEVKLAFSGWKLSQTFLFRVYMYIARTRARSQNVRALLWHKLFKPRPRPFGACCGHGASNVLSGPRPFGACRGHGASNVLILYMFKPWFKPRPFGAGRLFLKGMGLQMYCSNVNRALGLSGSRCRNPLATRWLKPSRSPSN